MNAYALAGLIFIIGAAGGFINCFHTGEFHLPRRDAVASVWRPGWVGQILVGGAAAVTIWGLYGPDASFDLIGPQPFVAHLTLAQCVMSFLVGFGGGRILTAEVQKRILTSERDAEKTAKTKVIEATQRMLSADEDPKI